MSVSKQEVEHIANLARINFTDEEKGKLMNDLNEVLLYMEKLNELDTSKEDIIVNPIYLENKFREDVVEPSLPIQDVIKNSPSNLEEYILVPKIIE